MQFIRTERHRWVSAVTQRSGDKNPTIEVKTARKDKTAETAILGKVKDVWDQRLGKLSELIPTTRICRRKNLGTEGCVRLHENGRFMPRCERHLSGKAWTRMGFMGARRS